MYPRYEIRQGGHRHPGKGNWLYQNQNRPVYVKFLWKLYY